MFSFQSERGRHPRDTAPSRAAPHGLQHKTFCPNIIKHYCHLRALKFTPSSPKIILNTYDVPELTQDKTKALIKEYSNVNSSVKPFIAHKNQPI